MLLNSKHYPTMSEYLLSKNKADQVELDVLWRALEENVTPRQFAAFNRRYDYQGQRVLTLEQVGEALGCSDKSVAGRLERGKHKFWISWVLPNVLLKTGEYHKP